MYQLLRNILFTFDAEKVHYFSMNILKFVCRFSVFRMIIRHLFKPGNETNFHFLGLNFQNKVGLGAGFDKNALYLTELETLGFGFVEIGTVTPISQDGNEKPRLFRLPQDQALINRMGFNNHGVDEIVDRLMKWRNKNPATKLIIGGNIGKNKITSNEDAWKDYEICFRKMYDQVDYFAVNVSSPNTPGLRALQDKSALKNILLPLIDFRKTRRISRPLLLKISPDLNNEDLDDIIDLTMELSLDGLIISNTTIERSSLKTKSEKVLAIGQGGLSGKPLKSASDKMIRYVHEKSSGKINIVGSGGIFTADDARMKMECGAKIIQVWTGFVYVGPSIIKKICK